VLVPSVGVILSTAPTVDPGSGVAEIVLGQFEHDAAIKIYENQNLVV
jgi:hypothetical protein